MKRNFLLLLCCLLLVLSGCGNNPPETSSSEPESSSGEKIPFTDADVQTGYAFEVTPIEQGTAEAMVFHANTRAKAGYLIDVLPGADFVPVGGDDWEQGYYISFGEGAGGMTVSLLSCPDNAVDFFNLKDPAELPNKLLAYIFSTADRHNGQLNAVKDFEYTLTADYYGEREGLEAFIVEFDVIEDSVHSVRFLSANDAIDEDYAGVSVRIDLPMDNREAYEGYMQMLHSLRRAEG